MTAGEWPLDAKGRENIKRIRDEIVALDGRIGGWTTKSQARQTGLSMHFRFENKVDLMETTLKFMGLIEKAPGMLVDALDRLLAAAEAADGG